jgi:hypothetical protein
VWWKKTNYIDSIFECGNAVCQCHSVSVSKRKDPRGQVIHSHLGFVLSEGFTKSSHIKMAINYGRYFGEKN